MKIINNGVLSKLEHTERNVHQNNRNNKPRYITGLDGLRAIAVLAVIAYHLNLPGTTGGLLGVTVFFVLSGYLITDLLISEWDSNKKINIKRFWIRRARRLLPGLFTMLLVVLCWVMLFHQDLLGNFLKDALAGSLYISNWWYIFHQLSYFESFESPSLLTHFWSLAVEEQFYIIWPIVIGLGLLFQIRRKVLFVLIIILAVISALMMLFLYQPGTDPSRVYYGTDTRVFSLLIGAALSFVWPSRKLSNHLPVPTRITMDTLGSVGMLMVIFMIFQTNQYEDFLYKGGMIIASLATALLVAVITHPVSLINKWLSMKPLRWIGVRSYGIYLWHYPIIVLTSRQFDWGDSAVLKVFIQLLLIFGLAAISYELIEKPIRNGEIPLVWKKVIQVDLKVIVVLAAGCVLLYIVIPSSILHASKSIEEDTIQTIYEETKESDSLSEEIEIENESDKSELKLDLEVPPLSDEEQQVTIIGDSVMVDVAPYLKEEFSNIIIDAKIGRQMVDAFNIIQEKKKKDLLGQYVVIALGNNGAFTKELLVSLIEEIGDDKEIFFVTTRVPRPWESVVNSTINKVASKYKNTKVIDWYEESRKDFFAADGVHLNQQGSQAYALLIAEMVKYN